MSPWYNRIVGQSTERLAVLSDGLFGVAMTLLLLDLNVPKSIDTESQLRAELIKLLPALGVYLMSFTTLGIFWVGQ